MQPSFPYGTPPTHTSTTFGFPLAIYLLTHTLDPHTIHNTATVLSTHCHSPVFTSLLPTGEPSDAEGDEQQQQQQQPPAGHTELQQPPSQPAAATVAAAAMSASNQTDAAAAEGPGGAAAAGVSWVPGCVSAVSGGAAELQQLLENIEEQLDSLAATGGGVGGSHSSHSSHPVVIDWVAPWAAASLAASQQLQALAATCRHLPVITVDVTASAANNAVALQKVMVVPQVYRKGGRQFHAVPKSGKG